MAVAAAVVSGAADTGLAVLSAAQALGLDFVRWRRNATTSPSGRALCHPDAPGAPPDRPGGPGVRKQIESMAGTMSAKWEMSLHL